MNRRPTLISTALAHYESTYERVIGEYSPSISLSSYLKLCQKRWGEDFFSGHWLELGCGMGSTFESYPSQSRPQVLATDFSTLACERARSRDLSGFRFECAHLECSWPHDWPEFDGILDSHLLHCLEGTQQIRHVLKNCLKHLKPGGTLVAEVMIDGKNFAPDEGLDFDEGLKVLKRSQGPVLHTLLQAFDWEQLILSAGLQIFYFEVYSHLRFIHNPKRSELLETDPEVLRFIAMRPQ